jgi:cation transport ATPase
VKSITGRGVQAQVDGETVHIGKPVLFEEISAGKCPPPSTRRIGNWFPTVAPR